MERRISKTGMVLLWVTVATLSIAVVVLSIFLGINVKEKNELANDMENRYQSAYYGLVTTVVDIENDLAKVRAMSGSSMLEETLENVNINCQLGNVYLSVLTTSENNMENLNRYLNQLSGYSHHIVRNLASGKSLTEEQKQSFDKMWQVSKEYGKALASVQDEISNGYSFVKSLGKVDDKFSGFFTDMDGNAIEYPTLIYDGPFSDGVDKREPKGTVGAELSEAQCRELLPKYLVGYEITEVKNVVENNNRIPSFVYSVILKGDRDCTVQIAKKGGMLLMLDLYHEVVEPQLTIEQCKVVAEQYCESIGLQNMKAVWINNNNSNVYVNLCYEQDGVVIYPDMIKLKISLDTGEVIGYEGLNYAFNHTERKTENLDGEVTVEEAVLGVSSSLQNVEGRKCMIPIDTVNEKLCIEVVGEINGEKYFVYVDAMTGDEIKVLRMIDSNQGDLLM